MIRHIFPHITGYTRMLQTVFSLLLFVLACTQAKAQQQATATYDPPITIGGNVYGGGNVGYTGGNTTVTIYGGDINRVFGGARMADVGGRAFVHIDGEHSTSPYTIINYVFGGNDISGKVGTSSTNTPPTELTHATQNNIDNTWDAYVRITASAITPAVYYTAEDAEVSGGTKQVGDLKTPAKNAHDIFLGQIFGGGNGNYEYSSTANTPNEGETTHYIYERGGTTPIAEKVTTTGEAGFTTPTLEKTYLELLGGSIGYVFGGGNNATVTEDAVIHVENPSLVVTSIIDTNNPNADPTTGELVTAERTTTNMALSSVSTYASSDDFQIGNLFGGNNRAAMAIQPRWNLISGKIRNIYSGGNEGDMTSPVGLLLEIPETSAIIADNIYGGCRKADVHPKNLDGTELSDLSSVQLADPNYHFPAGYSARVIVRGGDINNVYGGNDISGDVWGGSAVGIYKSIRGNVYGAGNGSYPYTDNKNFIGDVTYGDFYYDVKSILGLTGSSFTGMQSAQALDKHRPHAERVSLRLWGHSADNPTIIGGSVYVGGNSASLRNERDPNNEATGELKIGSHVYANNVFLGNNGENMVSTNILTYYHGNATAANGNSYDYSQMDLNNATIFAKYMNGCASSIRPSIAFDKKNDDGTGDPDTYQDYTTYFGSFFCGGNVGSMMWSGTAELDLSRAVVTFDKFVGGCNDAYVPVHYVDDDPSKAPLNATFMGGILGSEAEQAAGGMIARDNNGNPITDSEGNFVIKNASVINFSGTRIEPKRWVVKRNANYEPILTDGKVTYLATDNCELSNINNVCSHGKHAYLEWNTIKNTGEETAPVTSGLPANGISTEDDRDRRLTGGNIYGGCYNSGVVNGSIVININSSLMIPDILFDKVAEDELGEAVLYGNSLDDVLTQDKQNNHILARRTGVMLGRQGMDVLGKALNIFGGGYGADTEIWGSTTINLNQGYVFQIFGGSERGVIGKSTGTTGAVDGTYTPASGDDPATYAFNGKTFPHSSSYSCTVNVRGTKAGVSKQDEQSLDMAETEFLYGGSFMGPICGNTKINLGNGRVFNTFAGSCMADILGHTETYIGVQVNQQSVETGEGFPYVRDYTYSGNDLGGKIYGEADFINRVRTDDFDGDANTTGDNTKAIIQATNVHTANVTKASAYTEYRQGRVLGIYGGCYGTYEYSDPYYQEYFYTWATKNNEGNITSYSTGANATNLGNAKPGYTKPRMGNAFVNFRPTDTDALLANSYNFVNTIYGAGQGHPGDGDRDIMQKSSYVLIDIPQRMTNWLDMEVFGAGSWSGLGMDWKLVNKTATEIAALTPAQMNVYKDTLDVHSATIDLVRGQVGAAYGGSYSEGITRRTMVNVPDKSTIRIGSIFGGGYGTETFMPCDVYESNVEFHSANAVLIYNPIRQDANNNTIGHPLHNGAIYGGNNDKRRTLYTHINIDKRVNMSHYQYGMSRGYIFGAGKGGSTWAEYTEVNLNDGAEVYEVYGGGQAGKVFCAEAVTSYKKMPRSSYLPVDPDDDTKVLWPDGTYKEGQEFTDDDFNNAWKIGGGYDPIDTDNDGDIDEYWQTTATNLTNPLVRRGEIDDRNWEDITPEDFALVDHKYNTNVIIREGAYVANYAYGGGLGEEAMVGGHTYIALLGGLVNKDVYAGGTSGSVEDAFGGGNYSSTNNAGFEATTTAYIKGGTVRNVYGGGWRGDVGHHRGATLADDGTDVAGQSHVVIGDIGGTSYVNGIPSITRNVYGGGEGGSIFGTAYVRINNGYIGYRYKNTAAEGDTPVYEYVPELDDTAPNDNLLDMGGNVFGGGYVANSYTDYTVVNMYGGTVRGCMFGGGEIGPVGRGTVKNNPSGLIHKAGRTDVHMYSGHVMRNVFGGGRGYDNWNGDGTKLYSAEEIATMDLSSKGYVFGQTQVYIRGGEIGTENGVAQGFGNVFGGGDRGFVYSAYSQDVNYTQAECDAYNAENHLEEGMPGFRTTSDVKNQNVTFTGRKSGVRYNKDLQSTDPGYNDEGYYYEHNGTNFVIHSGEKILTEDCKVLIGVQCKAKESITINNVFYPKDAPVPPQDIAYIKEHYSSEYAKINKYGNVTDDDGITIDSRTYEAGEYVTTYALNCLKDKSNDPTQWAKLDDYGIIIHNAVFAGGNVSSGDDQIYANAPTVFGNATASIHDVYNRDLISIGTGHVGGLYGDGNLTFVDGYRGLNITNYGTDFYNLEADIKYADYQNLTAREKEYYDLMYECVQACTDKDGNTYEAQDKLSLADLQALFTGPSSVNYDNIFNQDGSVNSAYWEQKGVCSRYAGRILNTIQRADFCGVFGSRMVLQGAPDRVPETVDYTNYTVNRVREVSLNKKVSVAGDSGDKAEHGNYFGIYNIVNYLGALTSDVAMNDARKASEDYPNDPLEGQTSPNPNQTYYDYKSKHYKERKRNRASSHNKVALASGVYLELTTEQSTGTGVNQKDWGYITGVVELDLINVQKGVGGGYVYAKNVHGVPTKSTLIHNTITALNNDAVTRKDYTYSDDIDQSGPTASDMLPFQTSGNFVHNAQTIIDDCYDITAKYLGNDRSPAHYWYIKGEVYVYDQYISAYTGAPSAYKETVNIPLTITAASRGKMKLLNIQPNLYAYYTPNLTAIGSEQTIDIGGNTYGLNDPIDYWTWSLLAPHEQVLFLPKTYTAIANATVEVNGTTTTFEKGKVYTPDEYTSLQTTYGAKTFHNDDTNENVSFDFIFRETNNISHETGYILTYDVNNPMEWNKYYTPKTGAVTDKLNTDEYGISNSQGNYHDGPTYSIKTSGEAGIYGQRNYAISDIIDKVVYDTYQTMTTGSNAHIPTGTQATFKEAYVVTVDELETDDKNNNHQKLHRGSSLAKENYTDAQWTAISGKVAEAYVATTTIPVDDGYIFTGELVTAAQRTALITAAHNANDATLEATLTNGLVKAYYCTSAGAYGGNYYAYGSNYRGLEAWSSMSPADRAHFTFNYDALDVLLDKDYGHTVGQKYQYDDAAGTLQKAQESKAQYSLERLVDYTATYDKTEDLTVPTAVTVKHSTGSSESVTTIVKGDELTRVAYESLPNEKYHYAPITLSGNGTSNITVYVAKTEFIQGETPYSVGQVLSTDEYNALTGTTTNNVETLTFPAADAGKTYYYCRDSYQSAYLGTGKKITDIFDSTKQYADGATVPVGVIIEATTSGDVIGYDDLVNKQAGFTIHGVAPVETSTLYVARNSDIYDLSKDKIITVIYQYDYEESDDSGMHITPVSERHVVNIHLQFKSGIPIVEAINAPDIVLPGTNVVIRTPNVTPGAYEVLGGGWEIYRNAQDAESHANGTDYSPTVNPLYWYQDGYYVAYYAKTYLGKTFSNAVPVSVANYHDLKRVMEDKDHHYYLDNTDVKRDPKIYINDYTTDDPATSQNGLTLLKNLFDLSLNQITYDEDNNPVPISSGTLAGHNGVETSRIGGCKDLELFLRTDLAAPEATGGSPAWTPIGNNNSTQCFEGILHGDGHVVSGLDHSLFAHLCGEVYNLGVTGTFTTAGLADKGTGYVENCWVKSTATTMDNSSVSDGLPVRAVFDNPTNTDTRNNHVVNCYYSTTNAYTTQTGTTAKSESAFYNGEVTYDLNEFYLFKRYCDNTTPAISVNDYAYWKDENGTLSKHTGHYADVEGPYLVEDADHNYIGSYVESRFADGDFVYAGGTIPSSADKRFWTETRTVNGKSVVYSGWAPIWPDDYLFFGQTLNYGYVTSPAHQPLPAPISKNGDLLPTAASGVPSNRVYRAPAYFRSLTMGMAHFNPDAVFAQTKSGDATLIAHKNMTAIDFTGTNGDVASGYQRSWCESVSPTSSIPGGLPERFYPPLLDDDGLFSIKNINLTRNLLVYTGTTGGTGTGETPTASQQTANVVGAYLLDQAYAEGDADGSGYVENKDVYHTVAVWDSYSDNVKGHWVQGSGSSYTASRDHLLVDKQDFNAPISYTFADGKRMWHQRTPDTFVDMTKGWEGISIPFSAEIVTTQTKGELTHFYETAVTDSKGINVGSTGHEYWLREFKGDVTQAKDANNNDITGVYIANFEYPAAGSNTKEYTNTFLWDYYYQYTSAAREDKNHDIYQQEYYKAGTNGIVKTYSDYPYSTAGTPYIIGFPGTTYYEFDLSGTFLAENTRDGQTPAKLSKQTITFASPTGTTIAVSDTEIAAGATAATADSYTFTPNYLGQTIPTGSYTLAADGSSYVVTTAATAGVPFRPYFTKDPSTARGLAGAKAAERITFSRNTSSLGGADEQHHGIGDADDGTLKIATKRGRIIVKSFYNTDVPVTIINSVGKLFKSFTIAPGETVETNVGPGIYIVNQTKVAVK